MDEAVNEIRKVDADIDIMQEIHEGNPITMLLEYLHDPDPRCRDHIVRVLGKIGPLNAVSCFSFINHLDRVHSDPPLKPECKHWQHAVQI